MVASFQSTSLPFIQILPVPGKDMRSAPLTHYAGSRSSNVSGTSKNAKDRSVKVGAGLAREAKASALLQLAAERTLRRPGLQRLPAMPAETGLRYRTRLEARLDFGDGVTGISGDGTGRPS